MPQELNDFTTGLVERLEKVREEVGLSLKDWWKLLKKGEGFDYSYEGIRRYHRDREAPTSYLVHVAARYGVSLIWLATGKGSPSQELYADLEASAVAVRDAASDLALFGPSAYTDLMSLLYALQQSYGGASASDDSLQEEALFVAAAINDWALSPMIALSPQSITWSQKEAFFRLLMTALQLLMAGPVEAKTLEEVARHWKAVMSREQWEEED